jgi:hypothetical protein
MRRLKRVEGGYCEGTYFDGISGVAHFEFSEGVISPTHFDFGLNSLPLFPNVVAFENAKNILKQLNLEKKN